MKISEAILRAMSPGNEYSDHRIYAEVKKYVECSREAVLDTLDGLDSEGLVARGYTYDYAGTKWPCWVLTERGRRALERAELEPTQPSPQTVKLSCALARCVGVLEAIAGSEPYDDPVGHLARMRDFAKREAEAASKALAQVTGEKP